MKELPGTYAVLLAGGSGTRFWPKSRKDVPKQLCKIGPSSETMIRLTLGRLEGLIPRNRRMVITHKDQEALTREQVSDLCEYVIAEPASRNTAAALGLASYSLRALGARDDDVMISLHADHIIEDLNGFQTLIEEAVHCARRQKGLILLGAKPRYPETGYGYIQPGTVHNGLFKVDSFREKPNRAHAEVFLKEGYLWNTGMFVWTLEAWEREFRKHMPDMAKTLYMKNIDAYEGLPSIAVDHGVLEKSDACFVLPANIGWQDVGSWGALSQIFPRDERGNLVYADAHLIDCEDVVIDSDGPFIAAMGLKGMVVVAHKGAVMVCPKERAQDVKSFVTFLQQENRRDLL